MKEIGGQTTRLVLDSCCRFVRYFRSPWRPKIVLTALFIQPQKEFPGHIFFLTATFDRYSRIIVVIISVTLCAPDSGRLNDDTRRYRLRHMAGNLVIARQNAVKKNLLRKPDR